MRLPVMLFKLPPYLRIVCTWRIACSVYKFGRFSLPHCHGPCAIALGNDQTIPAARRPCVSIGHMMLSYCCWVKQVVTNRYSSFLVIICHILNSAAKCGTFAIAIDDCHCHAVSRR